MSGLLSLCFFSVHVLVCTPLTHQDGRTALYWAAQNGLSSVVEALLAKGANFEAVDKVAGGVGWRGFTSTTHQAGRKRA